MHARVVALGSIVLALGCTRSFAPVQAGDLADGTPCAAAGACASGICADGVCCAAACTQDQTCAALRNEGTCTDRKLGDACQANGDCPTGFCVDGVCCESACTDDCVQCNAPTRPGRCTLVADGTDPRQICAGNCTACYGGVCGPADPGTDPRSDCGAGLACAYDQTCRPSGGAACTQASDCALDACFAGSCLTLAIEKVPYNRAVGATQGGIAPLSVAMTSGGDLAIAVIEHQEDSAGGDLSTTVTVLSRSSSQSTWSDTIVDDLTGYERGAGSYAEVVFLGRNPFLIYWVPPISGVTCGSGECQIDARAIFSSGQLGPVEVVATGVQEGDNSYDRLLLHGYAEPSGRVVIGWVDARGFHTRYRTSGTWQAGADVPRPADYALSTWALGTLSGAPVFVSAHHAAADDTPYDASGFVVTGEDGTILADLPAASSPCQGEPVILTAPSGELPSANLHFGLQCDSDTDFQSYLGSLEPGGTLQLTKVLGTIDDPLYAANVIYIENSQTPRLAFFRAQGENTGTFGLDFGISAADQSNFGVMKAFPAGLPDGLAASATTHGGVTVAAGVDELDAISLAQAPFEELYVARLSP